MAVLVHTNSFRLNQFYTQSLSQKNLLDLLSDLESELKIGHVAEHMLALAVARNVLLRDLFELADRGKNVHTRPAPKAGSEWRSQALNRWRRGREIRIDI